MTLIFYDILLVSETWRDKREEAIVTAAGHNVLKWWFMLQERCWHLRFGTYIFCHF